MKLSIILATRGRPALLRQTVERTLLNIKCPDTRLIIAVDDDDMDSIVAASELSERSRRVITSVMPREDSLGEKYNNRMSVAPADVYLAMVDYAPHVTPGFDAKILDAASVYPDGIGVVYNHMANMSFPQINAVTHRLAELMGGMYPGHFPFWFVDHWLDDVAKMIDRIVFADVEIDTSARPGTMESREPFWWATFFDAMAAKRQEIALSIINAPDFADADWRKDMLVSRFPLIEYVSQAINDHVRAMPWAKDGADPARHDERYKRIKAAAMQVVAPYVREIQRIEREQTSTQSVLAA